MLAAATPGAEDREHRRMPPARDVCRNNGWPHRPRLDRQGHRDPDGLYCSSRRVTRGAPYAKGRESNPGPLPGHAPLGVSRDPITHRWG
jgi:hypothetical protein